MRVQSLKRAALREIAVPVVRRHAASYRLSPTEASLLLEAVVGTSRSRFSHARRITELTFKRHVSNLLQKLGAPSLLHAVAHLLREIIAMLTSETKFAIEPLRGVVYGHGMPDLNTVLEKLAADFAAAAASAIQHASLEDIASLSRMTTKAAPAPRATRAPKSTRGRGRRRRTAADIGKVTGEIAALLAKHAGGLRAEEIRAELGLPRNELPKPLAEGLASGKFKKRGQKRATVYFIGAGSSAPAKKVTPKAHRAAKAKPNPRAKPARRAAAPRKAKARAKRAAAESTKHPTSAATNGAAKTATPPA